MKLQQPLVDNKKRPAKINYAEAVLNFSASDESWDVGCRRRSVSASIKNTISAKNCRDKFLLNCETSPTAEQNAFWTRQATCVRSQRSGSSQCTEGFEEEAAAKITAWTKFFSDEYELYRIYEIYFTIKQKSRLIVFI
jgi:hypothetical protein